MIDIDKLRMVKQVFYHANCADGTAAAIILATAYHLASSLDDFEEFHSDDADFPAQPEFVALQHNTDLMNNLVPQEGQLFVDITPPKDRWEEWKEFSPIVLDHHETAEHIVKGLGGIYGTNDKYSGAMLAFEYVLKAIVDDFDKQPDVFDDYELAGGVYDNPSKHMIEWENFATNAMIRDTWKKDHIKWKESCEQSLALQFFGADEFIKDIQFGREFDFKEIKGIGRMLYANMEQRISKIASMAFHSTVRHGNKTYNVSFFNCPDKMVLSDVGDYLLNSGDDIAVGYFYLYEEYQQRLCVSLRSKPHVSVSSIAKVNGGGGHHQAAGFSILNANSVAPSELIKYIESGLLHSKK